MGAFGRIIRMSSKNIISLDIARSIAAILVFMSHVRAYLMVDFKELSSNSTDKTFNSWL